MKFDRNMSVFPALVGRRFKVNAFSSTPSHRWGQTGVIHGVHFEPARLFTRECYLFLVVYDGCDYFSLITSRSVTVYVD